MIGDNCKSNGDCDCWSDWFYRMILTFEQVFLETFDGRWCRNDVVKTSWAGRSGLLVPNSRAGTLL